MTARDPDAGPEPSRDMASIPPDRGSVRSARLALVGASVVVLLATWVIWKFGGFDLTTTIDVDGRGLTIANTFATVDHPFHATRGDTLLRSLQDGQLLRWIGHHQGGYPVEFYPLGIPWLDVGLWALLLGAFPIVTVHKLAVLIVFILPAVGFWLLARGDRLSPFVAVLALAIHVATPGLWHTGGMIETIEWGLVANAGGATLAFIALAALARYVLEGGRWVAVLAIVSSSAALYTNTRSGIAVGVAALSVLAAIAVANRDQAPVTIRVALARVALVGGGSALLTAPLLLSLLQYVDRYFFVNFMNYNKLGEYWGHTLSSVSQVLIFIAMAGALIPVIVRRMTVWRIVSVTTVMYVVLTIVLSLGGVDKGMIPQLETPRLVPFQRLLMIYLAAAAIGWMLEFAARKAQPRLREPLVAAALMVGAVIVIGSYDGAYGRTPENHFSSQEPTTGILETVQFSGIVAEANEIRPEGTAIYVVGDQESWWHEQTWGPTYAEAPFFYDDWMWYWHSDFDAPYDFNVGHFIPDPAATFTPDWLQGNGIGALVVTNMPVPLGDQDPRVAARTNPALEHQVTIGDWDLYLVRDPQTIVTNGDVDPNSLTIENQAITATFESASGPVEIRRNWFPRWEAFVDGRQFEVERTANGYMRIDVPEGAQVVELRYSVTPVDWLARFLALSGVVLTVGIALGLTGNWWKHRKRQSRGA